MRLLSVELQGYKRFLKRTKLKVGGKVTALVGPNEAGKSSILEALAGAFSKDWAEHSVNWAVKQQSDLVDSERAEVVMHFSIDDGDRTRLQHLPLVALPRRMTVRKTVYGVSMSFEPPAQWTDQRPFVRQLYADMERLGRVLKRRSDIDQGFEQEKFQRLEYVLNHQHQFLPSVLVDDTIQPDGIEGLRHLLSYLETSLPVLAAEILGEGEPDVLSKVVSSLARLAFFSESEVTAILENLRQLNQMLPYFKETPEATVYRYLGAGIPTPILFKPADYLPPSVAILQRKMPDEEDPATARLRLLLKVAEVNFDHLVDLLERGHGSGARAELVQGERRLNQGLLAAWPFSDLQVRFHLEGQTITLELMEAGTGHLIPLGVRSAGAQFFLSLFVFLNHFTGPVTGASWIILIDEIEQHLHVDAQRSIVEGLERQAMVGQVIYTTHSPFALPADLTAIRSVEPDVPGGTSRIHNKVWADRQTNKREGLERLFTMMGASVGMFNAARAALVTEGETDLEHIA